MLGLGVGVGVLLVLAGVGAGAAGVTSIDATVAFCPGSSVHDTSA